MRRWNRRSRQGGFTLIELLIVFVLVLILALIGFPALDEMIVRVKIRQYTTEVANLMQRSRIEAVKYGGARITVDSSTGLVQGVVDVNGDGVYDEPVLAIRPQLPKFIEFVAPGGLPVFEGLTVAGDVATVTFNRDGSVDNTGAIRVGDARGNFFEFRISPQASGRVQVRKWDEDKPVNRDGTHWYGSGEQGPWEWVDRR